MSESAFDFIKEKLVYENDQDSDTIFKRVVKWFSKKNNVEKSVKEEENNEN